MVVGHQMMLGIGNSDPLQEQRQVLLTTDLSPAPTQWFLITEMVLGARNSGSCLCQDYGS